MPWGPKSATGFTKSATTAAKRKRWSVIANRVLKQSGDEGKAIRIANAAMNRQPRRRV